LIVRRKAISEAFTIIEDKASKKMSPSNAIADRFTTLQSCHRNQSEDDIAISCCPAVIDDLIVQHGYRSYSRLAMTLRSINADVLLPRWSNDCWRTIMPGHELHQSYASNSLVALQ